MNTRTIKAVLPARGCAFRLVLTTVMLIAFVAPVWATPVTTHPYLGITRITDSFTLLAPLDQTAGSGLGTHTANVNVVFIDFRPPGIGFKVSPDNGAAAGETLTLAGGTLFVAARFGSRAAAKNTPQQSSPKRSLLI